MPFSDPITAGDVLVRNAIQSDNFVTNVAGWQIRKGGGAEFSTLAARGTITVTDGAGNTVSLQVSPGINFPAIIYALNGFLGTGQMYFQQWTTNRDELVIRMAGEFGDTINMRFREDINGFGEIVVNQEIVSEDPAALGVTETWHNVALQSGWTNFGAPFSNFQYRRLPHGFVGLEGTINPGTRASGTLLGTLPGSYQPTQAKRVLWAEVGFVGALDIATNGQITLAGAVPAGVSTITVQTQFALGII